MEFDEVEARHFTSISRVPFPHVLIEHALLRIAGGGADVVQFRNDVLESAGWPHSARIAFSEYPEQAAAAFNRIRLVLQESEDPITILTKLKQ